MKKFLSALLLTSIASVSWAQFPQTRTVYVCQSCDSYASFQDYANSRAGAHIPGSKFHVVSLENERVRGYVSALLDPMNITPDGFVAQGATVDADVQADFDDVLDAKRTAFGTVYHVNPELANSVWDMSGSSAMRNYIALAISQNATVADKVGNYVAAVVKLTEMLANYEVEVWVQFADGGKARFKVVAIDPDGNFVYEYVPGSAIDVNQNDMAESVSDFSGQYILDGIVDEVVQAAARWGATLNIDSNCQNVDMVCTNDGENMDCTATVSNC